MRRDDNVLYYRLLRRHIYIHTLAQIRRKIRRNEHDSFLSRIQDTAPKFREFIYLFLYRRIFE